MRSPAVVVTAVTGRYVTVNSWSWKCDPWPFEPPPLNTFADTRLRLSVFTHDQTVSNPSNRIIGPPRVSRSFSVPALKLKPPPASQLLTNAALAFTLPPLTRRSPSKFHTAYSLKFSSRRRNQRFGTSLRSETQLIIHRSSARRTKTASVRSKPGDLNPACDPNRRRCPPILLTPIRPLVPFKAVSVEPTVNDVASGRW